jgi:SAM-dependent MidA family methyltransferase
LPRESWLDALPGLSDIRAWVDFTAIAALAQQAKQFMRGELRHTL